ncbi:MAG: esterase family protein [Alphaproteobacteria bacterium]|nr:esterase family protein [Alphaproteobacteria bacterium]MDE2498975.1 esterase family protein [Alphaproteobacteria bacterium]
MTNGTLAALAFALLVSGNTPAVAAAQIDPTRDGDFTIGPDYAPAPETVVHAGVPAGTIHEFTMASTDSRLYPGIKRVENGITKRRDAYGNRMAAPFAEISVAAPYTRKVWVYVPAQYIPGTPAPFIVVQDGHSYVTGLPTVLDNLIAAHKVPAMIAVMVDPGGGDAQGSERGLEYDTLSGRYSDFIESEVLPKISKDYGVVFTKNPDGRAAMGGSSGAAAAFTMAWFHPERYHRVLSYSGTFVNQQSPRKPATPEGAWDYHAGVITRSKRKPLRIWLEVGEKDLHFDDPESTYHNWPMANKQMAAVLTAKGYHYQFVFAKDAHHVDNRVLEQTMPEALEWLWRGYPIK